jgi:hypothetical protein
MKQYTYHISENELLDNHRNCLLKFESLKSLHLQLVSENILPQKIKNFGRLSHLSKQKILLTAYLLHRHPIMEKSVKRYSYLDLIELQQHQKTITIFQITITLEQLLDVGTYLYIPSPQVL